jgi:hypothetical protein
MRVVGQLSQSGLRMSWCGWVEIRYHLCYPSALDV